METQPNDLLCTLHLHMEDLPTGVYHLFDAAREPLAACVLENGSDHTRQLRIRAWIESYSDETVATASLPPRTAFLSKPFTPSSCARALRELLDRDG